MTPDTPWRKGAFASTGAQSWSALSQRAKIDVSAVVNNATQMRKSFRQVNVFSADPLGGNPLAVVHAAEGLSEAHMAALARWTNLSETTFLLPPTDSGARLMLRLARRGRKATQAGPRDPAVRRGPRPRALRRSAPGVRRAAFASYRSARARCADEDRQGAGCAAVGYRSAPVGRQWPGLVRGGAAFRASGAFAQARLGFPRSVQA